MTLWTPSEKVTTHTVTTTHNKMRTKTLLLAAAAAVAGIASLQAQSNVYSVNVVGYVNVTIPAGFSLIANPLNSSDNTVSNLFHAADPQGATVFTWNGSFFAGNRLDDFGGGWANPAEALPPGKGFFVNTATAFTNTFVGEVLTGNLTNSLPAGYSLVSSKVPQAGFVQDLGLAATPGDTIFMWNGTFFAAIRLDDFGGGWPSVAPFTVDPVKGPQIGVAQSFFYQSADGSATWVRNFTIP